MLLKEFLESDMSTYLDIMLNTVQKNGAARAADVQNLITPMTPSTNSPIPPTPITVDIKGVSQDPNGFVAPRDFKAQAPAVMMPKVEVVNKIDSSEIADAITRSVSTATAAIQPSNPVNDSSSLRNVIREELSGLRQPLPPSKFDASSPSQLRSAIKSELQSIISSGGIPQLASESTLRGIIHDEMAKSGAINKKREYVPQNIHIDESLLHPTLEADDVQVIKLMKKDPQERTRREELSVLGKLEDLLVDLKSTLQSGSRKKAVAIYRKLQTNAQTLRFFIQERDFLFQELQLISTYLFAPEQSEPEVKKVILKESTGEITTPFQPKDIVNTSTKNSFPRVYHVTLNKQGTKKIVDPKNQRVVVHKNISGTQVHLHKKKVHINSKKKPTHVVVKNMSDVAKKRNKIFYMLEQDGETKKRVVYHKKLSKRNDFHLFSTMQKKVTVDHLKAAKKRFDEIREQSSLMTNTKKLTPWEDKHQQMHNSLHTKSYLKALRALRQNDKSTAVDILKELHGKYPRNVAIKVRLHDALQL